MLLSRRGFDVVFPAPGRRLHDGQARPKVSVAAKKQQKKQRKAGSRAPRERRLLLDDDEEYQYLGDDGELQLRGGRPSGASLRLPEAPSPSTSGREDKDEATPYVVFAPKPSAIQSVRGGSWGWDDEPESTQPPVPEWNPRTGFMGSSVDVGSEAEAPASVKESPDVSPSFLTPSTSEGELPSVSSGQIISSCLGTGFWMTIFAIFIRQYAQVNSPQIFGTDPDALAELLRIPSGVGDWENVGIIAGAVVLVTAARLQLLARWPEFRSASDRSNAQVLQPLGWFEIVLIAGLSGVTEEFLFRGAIIPATFPDWRGALAAGVVFGLLHNNGGRNLAFASWASAVGIFYGGLFVYTHNIWVPAAAHAVANFCSAAAWKATHSGPSNTESL